MSSALRCDVSARVVLVIGMVVELELLWPWTLTALPPMALWLVIVTSGMLTSLVLPNPMFGEIPPWLLQTILTLCLLSLVISPLVVLNVVVLPLAVMMRIRVGVTMVGYVRLCLLRRALVT